MKVGVYNDDGEPLGFDYVYESDPYEDYDPYDNERDYYDDPGDYDDEG